MRNLIGWRTPREPFGVSNRKLIGSNAQMPVYVGHNKEVYLDDGEARN